MMLCSEKIRNLIKYENIDRKKVDFQIKTRFVSNDRELFVDPEVIIIKNESGKRLFDCLVEKLKLNYREKEITLLKNIKYPYYILTMDWITCGCRFGNWGYYQKLEDMDKEIDTNNMRDDFNDFEKALLRILG